MTLSSRHRIRNSSPGGLRPSTLPLGHGDSPQYWLSHVDGEEILFVSFKPPRPGTEPQTLALKAAVLHVGKSVFITRSPAIEMGGGPRVVVSTTAFHARVRGSVPGLGGLKKTKNVSSPSTCESRFRSYGPTAHWSDGPLVWRPIGLTDHF